MKTYTTGNIYVGLRRWAKITATPHFATFCLLKWAEDCVKERGVMYMATEIVRVKCNKHGVFFKKPFGVFAESSDEIEVRGVQPLPPQESTPSA